MFLLKNHQTHRDNDVLTMTDERNQRMEQSRIHPCVDNRLQKQVLLLMGLYRIPQDMSIVILKLRVYYE